MAESRIAPDSTTSTGEAIDLIVQELARHSAQIWQASAEMRYWHDHYLDEFRLRFDRRAAEIEADFQARQEQLQAAQREALVQANNDLNQTRESVEEQIAELGSSFRWIMSSWDEPAWDAFEPDVDSDIVSSVRVGWLDAEIDADLPALVPLVGHGSLFLTGDDADIVYSVQQAILLRLVVSFPPGTLRLNLADPVGLGSHLATFLRLPDSLRGDKICSRPEEIGRQLDFLEQHIEGVIQTRLQNLYTDIETYNQQAQEMAVPYTVFALTGFPAGFDDRMAERLVHIARNGPRAGVYVIASLDPARPAPRNFNLEDLTNLGTLLHVNRKPGATSDDLHLQWQDRELGHYPVVSDPLPPAERVNQWLDAVKLALDQAATSLDFRRIAIPAARRWTGSSMNGLIAPIGMDSTGNIHVLELDNGERSHGLIGGMIGSGKSNLLHVLITQLALAYSPEELQMLLVDLKEGVEFQDYLRLPHARVVALESEREFGLSILRSLRDEMEARGNLFKSVSGALAPIRDVPAYRQPTGRPLPRLLLVMDEFQVLFSDDDHIAREAGRILEDIARRGRSFGIHLVLSSQSPSVAGLYGDRVYNQVGVRIALRCRAQDAQKILGEGNAAAQELSQKGQAIYNDEMGHKAKNVLIRVALSHAEQRQAYLADIGELVGDGVYPPPVTFEARAPARLEASAGLRAALAQPGWSGDQAAVPTWLGEPIEIKPPTTAPFERYLRSNLLIAGGDEAQAYGLMTAALLSLAAQLAPAPPPGEGVGQEFVGAAFYMADFARPSSPYGGLFERLAAGLPHPMEVAGPRQVNVLLEKLLTILLLRQDGNAGQNEDIYFAVAGLRQWRELRGADAYVQSDPAKKLARLADEGPEAGIHLILWTDSVAALEPVFKRAGLSCFDLRVALHLAEKDSNDLLGNNAAARLGENRALFRHEAWEMGRLEKFKPYSVPDPATLAALVRQIGAKGA